MKVSREQAAQNRERILDAAAQLFRERGFDGIGVADLMEAAGLTHGGFYGHFSSKEDLMAQACARALTRSLEVWNKRADGCTERSVGLDRSGLFVRQASRQSRRRLRPCRARSRCVPAGTRRAARCHGRTAFRA